MRGKGRLRLEKPNKNRITPAYAGKSSCPDNWREILEDHPRLCGEKSGELKALA